MKQKILKIRELISKARLKEAITAILQLDTTYNDVVISLNARLSALKLQQLAGIISTADEGLERRRVTNSLVEIISSIEKDMEVEVNPEVNTKPSIKKQDSTKKIMLIYHATDANYAEGISSHLFPKIRSGAISIFDIQEDVPPNEDRAKVLETELQQSDLILALISNNLYKKATQKIALEVEKQVGNKRVIPIKVTPFNMDGTPFERLQGLPLGNKSLSEYNNIDTPMYEISKAIINLIDKM